MISMKNNAGRHLSVVDMASALSGGTTRASNGVSLAAVRTGADEAGIPAFLRREPTTADEQAALRARHQNTVPRSPPITSPRDAAAAPAGTPDQAGATKKKAGGGAGRRGVGTVAVEQMLAGATNVEALAAVMREFPDCGSNLGCMNWYRNKLKKKGQLGQDGRPILKTVPAKLEAPKAEAQAVVHDGPRVQILAPSQVPFGPDVIEHAEAENRQFDHDRVEAATAADHAAAAKAKSAADQFAAQAKAKPWEAAGVSRSTWYKRHPVNAR